MLKRKVQKVKDSHIVTIPSDICQLMNINKDTEMRIELEKNNVIRMTPVAVVRQDQTATEAGTTTTEGDCNG